MSRDSRGVEEKSRIIRGGFWFYLSNVVVSVMGFIYWMAISIIAGPSVLGYTSAIVSLSFLLNGIAGLGVNYGLQRFLGLSYGSKNIVALKKYFWSTFYVSMVIYGIVSIVLFILGVYGYLLPGFTREMTILASVMVFLGVNIVFQSFYVGIVKTHILTLVNLVGNSIRLFLGIFLVYLGFSWIGATLGYIATLLVGVVIGLAYVMYILGRPTGFSLSCVKDVYVAGLASWIPFVIMIAGQWFGVLSVFGYTGVVETGVYYISFTIANFVIFIGASMVQLLLPVLSGMVDGRKRLASWVMKISIVLVSPLSMFLVFYPETVLGLLGEKYVGGASLLSILVLSGIPIVATLAINNLVYAYGMYSRVLGIGLAQNIPRLLLYLLLTPVYGGYGAAIAYTIGSFTGLAFASITSYSIGFRAGLQSLAKAIILPAAVAGGLYILGVPWYFALGAIIAVIVIGYPKLGVVTRSDVRELVKALYLEDYVKKMYSLLKPIIDYLF